MKKGMFRFLKSKRELKFLQKTFNQTYLEFIFQVDDNDVKSLNFDFQDHDLFLDDYGSTKEVEEYWDEIISYHNGERIKK